MRASVWVAQRPVKLVLSLQRRWNLQFFNLKRSRVANSSTVSVNGKALDLWKEIWPTNLVDTTLEGSVVWLDKMPDNMCRSEGKIVAINLMPPTPIGNIVIPLLPWVSRKRLLSHGVAAIILLLMIL
jgi:hypothetical protein